MHMRKKHLFLKAKLTEFANTDALSPDERAQRRGGLESGKTANETQILSGFFDRFSKRVWNETRFCVFFYVRKKIIVFSARKLGDRGFGP